MDDTTFTTVDGLSGDEACIVVRQSGEHVGLAVSLKSDGDYEVFLDQDAVRRLVEALMKAAVR